MGKRTAVGLGFGAAMLWSVGLLWAGARFVQLPIFALMPTIMTAFLAPGLVMAAMVGWRTWRRAAHDALDMGDSADTAQADRDMVEDTMHHLVLGLCIWPAAAVLLGGAGPGVIVTLGAGLAVARLIYWVGYHRAVGLRVFGQVASLAPTLMVAVWAVWALAARF